MRSRYSKPISIQKFQASQLASLKTYHNKIIERAKRYSTKALVKVRLCPICSSDDSIDLLKIYGYTYKRCQHCTHLFLSHRLPDNDLRDFYSSSKEYATTYTDEKQLQYRLEHIARPKVKFVMDQISVGKNNKWLDVGSAIGDVLKAVEECKGWQATGLEISSDSVAAGKKLWQVDLRQQLLSNFVSSNSIPDYTVVSAFGYYGLVANPLEQLAMAATLTKPRGYLVIGDTKADSLSTLLQQSFPELSLRHLIPPNTIHSFTEHSLFFALKKLGFKPIAIWRFGLDFSELLKQLSLLQPNFQSTPIFDYLSSHSNTFQTVIDQEKKSDYMVVVAQKR